MVYHKPSLLVLFSNDWASSQTRSINTHSIIYFAYSSSLDTFMHVEIQKTQWIQLNHFSKTIVIEQFLVADFEKPLYFVLFCLEIQELVLRVAFRVCSDHLFQLLSLSSIIFYKYYYSWVLAHVIDDFLQLLSILTIYCRIWVLAKSILELWNSHFA